MKITITDDEGVVFSTYEIPADQVTDGHVQAFEYASLYAHTEGFGGDPDEELTEFFSDLHTKARNERNDHKGESA